MLLQGFASTMNTKFVVCHRVAVVQQIVDPVRIHKNSGWMHRPPSSREWNWYPTGSSSRKFRIRPGGWQGGGISTLGKMLNDKIHFAPDAKKLIRDCGALGFLDSPLPPSLTLLYCGAAHQPFILKTGLFLFCKIQLWSSIWITKNPISVLETGGLQRNRRSSASECVDLRTSGIPANLWSQHKAALLILWKNEKGTHRKEHNTIHVSFPDSTRSKLSVLWAKAFREKGQDRKCFSSPDGLIKRRTQVTWRTKYVLVNTWTPPGKGNYVNHNREQIVLELCKLQPQAVSELGNSASSEENELNFTSAP